MVPFCAASMFMTLRGLSLYAAEAVDSTTDDALIKKIFKSIIIVAESRL